MWKFAELYRCLRNRTLQQFSVLLKLVQLLGMILNLTSQGWKCKKGTAMLIRDCRNVTLPSQNIPDSELTLRDVGLFTRDHVQTVEDSEGIAAIDWRSRAILFGRIR